MIIKPGEQEVIDLKTTLKLRTQNNGQIKVRPIITSSGIITMQLKTSPTKSELLILNLTTKCFAVKSKALISSILNTRGYNAEITFQEKTRKTNPRLIDGVLAKRGNSANTISISTECSGMDTPVTALNKIAEEVLHLSSSDICPAARKTILANHTPE